MHDHEAQAQHDSIGQYPYASPNLLLDNSDLAMTSNATTYHIKVYNSEHPISGLVSFKAGLIQIKQIKVNR